MKTRLPHRRRVRGFSLIEVLVSIVVFAVGVLSFLGLQARSVRLSTEAQNRNIAALLANDLVSRMWVSNRTAATLQANFGSTANGAGYQAWAAKVSASGLPSASSTVAFSSVAGGGSSATASSLATITITWQGPANSGSHNYVLQAQMK